MNDQQQTEYYHINGMDTSIYTHTILLQIACIRKHYHYSQMHCDRLFGYDFRWLGNYSVIIASMF